MGKCMDRRKAEGLVFLFFVFVLLLGPIGGICKTGYDALALGRDLYLLGLRGGGYFVGHGHAAELK